MPISKNETMRGVWLENQTIILRDDLPLPELKTGEALIRLRQAGICGTDLQLLKGYYPFIGIPGHEFVGEVVQAPEAAHLIGKRVVGEINIGCGQCALCHSGLSKHCRQRSVLGIKNHNGAFADYLSLPVANLHVVPDHLPDEKAVFAEPVAAAARILEQVNIDPGNSVLVIGAGRLGLLIAQVVNTTQCQLRVVARHDKQKQILKQFGVTAIDDHQLPSSEADIVIEASGSPSGLQSAIKAVKPTGTIVLKSTYAGETGFNFSRIVVDEINIIGSRCGAFEPALKLFADNQIDPTPLISHQFSLYQALQAFEAASRPGSLKVILHPAT
ncbi:MAG: alcohol dehydrogenase catalytic domain-containing protein [Gammaproteobacteria bacterium]|jgi:2-desacetyl-2-hydroxyethyl bacteriochlorophyllide A dehydrogenase